MSVRRFFMLLLTGVLLLPAGCAVAPPVAFDPVTTATASTEAPTASETAAQTSAAKVSTATAVPSAAVSTADAAVTTTTAAVPSASTTASTRSTTRTLAPMTTAAPPDDGRWVELFKDNCFERGIEVVSVDRTVRKLFDFGDPGRAAGTTWRLTQHFSRHDIVGALPQTAADGAVYYETPGKRITLREGSDGGELQMEMLASGEYDAPRREGEAWPHLLIEQSLNSAPIVYYDQLLFTMTVRKDYLIPRMDAADYNPNLHCYQTGMVFIVQNMNRASAGFGDEFLWFGVPVFDSRMEYKEAYCNADVGKEDASGQLIYQMGGRAFFDSCYTANPMTSDGQWVTVQVDILPAVKEAFRTAKEQGLMPHTAYEDLRLQDMNFGCESPGTFDASISIKYVSLRAHRK